MQASSTAGEERRVWSEGGVRPRPQARSSEEEGPSASSSSSISLRASPCPRHVPLTQTTVTSLACQPELQMDHETPGCHHPWFNLLCQAGLPCTLILTTFFCSSFILLLVSAPSTPALKILPISQGPDQTFREPSLATQAHTSFSYLLLCSANLLLMLCLDQGFQHLRCVASQSLPT